jgi:hypothetical protein
MAIKIRCACGNLMLVPNNRLGQTGNCPACNRSITVQLSQDMNSLLADSKDSSVAQELSTNQKKKKSVINKLLTLFVYSCFLLLISTSVLIFAADKVKPKYLQKVPAMEEIWDNNQGLILYTRSFYQETFFSKKTVESNSKR